MRALFFLLVISPLIEVALMSHWVGFWNTLMLVVGSGALGLFLLRRQGLAALNTSRHNLATGQLPLEALTDSLFLALAGILFVHPGFVTDILAIACLIPNFRHLAAKKLAVQVAAASPIGARYGGAEDIIEGEYEPVSTNPPLLESDGAHTQTEKNKKN